MNYLTMKLGAFGAGLLGGLLVTFLWLGVSLAANEGPGLTRLTDLARPAAQTVDRIAGPPPLALRLSPAAQPTPGPTPEGTPGPAPLDKFTFLPIVLK